MAQNFPKQLYRRGKQGTLVYSPDIAVFVMLSNNEILDLSPYVVEFNIGRVVNDISTFSCSIDNKFSQFDRVIKRMDRITVFLKRISWLQVFSGYVTTIPWQTVVPGNVTISAQCTLKRLAHNYFDANSTEGMALLPFRNERSFNEADGGAASTVVRLLTKVAQWPAENIFIQSVPEEWSVDASKVIDGLIQENDVTMTGSEFQDELVQIKNSLISLIDAMGWSGAQNGSINNALINNWADMGAGTPTEYSEAEWRQLVGTKKDNQFGAIAGLSGDVPTQYRFNLKANGLKVRGNHLPGTGNDQKTFDLELRLDAADSLAALVAEFIKNGKRDVSKLDGVINVPITAAYLNFDEQTNYINAKSGGCLNNSSNIPADSNTTLSASERFTKENGMLEYYQTALKEYEKTDYETTPYGDTVTKTKKYYDAVEKLKQFEADRLRLSTTISQQGMGVTTKNYSWSGKPVIWMDYKDYKFVFQTPQGTTGNDVIGAAPQSVVGAFKIKCTSTGTAGASVFGWATAIKIERVQNVAEDFYSFVVNKLEDYGWKKREGEGENVWVFKGNDKYPVYWDAYSRSTIGGRVVSPEEYSSNKYTGAYVNVDGQFAEKMDNTGIKALFNVLWMGNQSPQTLSEIAVGERSWLNDSPVLEVIKNICPSSVRDFMSAPNGDFIAFVPDRIGRYSNFPAIQIRDIEVIDFKAIASDANLVTHYLSNADVEAAPLDAIDTAMQLLFTSAMMTVDQAPLMNFMLGLPIDKTDEQYGPTLISTFGLRPKVEDNRFIRNRAFNFTYALHKFQEMWANQWQFVVNLTFMPELYPGMRIELVDRTLPDGTPCPVAVYVESVSHSGSRSTGFTTTAVVSTPMFKANGVWQQYRPEFGPKEMADTNEDIMALKINEQRISAKTESLRRSGILDNLI